MRIEPAPSDAVDAGTRAAATAVAGPPLEPPDVCCGFQGLRVMPPAGVSVNGQTQSSGVRTMPTTIAPAARRRCTSSASTGSTVVRALEPIMRTWPATGVSSLTAIGTPSSGRASPERARAPAWSASSSARSAKTTRKALSSGSRRSMRSSVVSTSSRGVTRAVADELRPGARHPRRRGRGARWRWRMPSARQSTAAPVADPGVRLGSAATGTSYG